MAASTVTAPSSSRRPARSRGSERRRQRTLHDPGERAQDVAPAEDGVQQGGERRGRDGAHRVRARLLDMPPVTDRSAARAALLARYRAPSRPPFPGAVAITCDVCGNHVLWVNPPLPSVPTVCQTCAGTNR